MSPSDLWCLQPSHDFSAVPEPDLDEAAVQALARGGWASPERLVFQRNNDRRQPAHLAYGGYPELLLASRKVCEALEQAECTGWRAYPILLIDENAARTVLSEDHAVLGVTGRAELTRVPEPPTDEVYENRFLLADGGWDGSDVWRSSAGALISGRGRAALKKAKLRVGFVRLEDVRW